MKHFKTDLHLMIGLFLIIISAGAYLLELHFFTPSDEIFTMAFFFHYALALVYYVVLWKTFGKKFFNLFNRELTPSHIMLLALFNIAAFSLNKNLTVFYESVDWLTILLVVENCLIIALVLLKYIPKWLSIGSTFIIGTSLAFHLYQSLMILPSSAFGFVGIPFFGISLLLFVPIFYLIGLVGILRSLQWSKLHTTVFTLGIAICLGISLVYVFQWQGMGRSIAKANLAIDAPNTHAELPDWITVAQNLNNTVFFEKYLKTKLVYQTFASYRDPFFSFGRLRFTGHQLHDPLIAIASAFSTKDPLDDKSKIKILNYLYDTRHETGDRFWSGSNLTTGQVVTNVEMFPESRLSYTEMILTVKNTLPKETSRWRNQQEAFYTFRLPDGGVVTSLSLWIDGEEQKGILTAKSKAETAYNTIVGRELRDPSVVYWMEGNKIRVRVFPCTPLENRKFKIGITAPLTLQGTELVYHSIIFQGPDYSKARSAVNIIPNGAKIPHNQNPFSLHKGLITFEGDYRPNWKLSMVNPTFESQTFSFSGSNYALTETLSLLRPRELKNIYLDLTSIWTREELHTIYHLFPDQKIYVYNQHTGKFISPSVDEIELSHQQAFTLFPFHKINGHEHSLVITKGGLNTPNLSDLKGSNFSKSLNTYFRSNRIAPLVFDIGHAPSDFMRSLKEFKVIDYNQASITAISGFVKDNLYPTSISTPGIVHIPQSGLSIKKEPGNATTTAPDHLMRLFSYQQVMHEIGNSYFNQEDSIGYDDHIVNLAANANIVTPVSSLIVLETQKDYERFEIEQKKDSLGNAEISNAGAAPEPHEWALIIIGIGFLCYMFRKSLVKLSFR